MISFKKFLRMHININLKIMSTKNLTLNWYYNKQQINKTIQKLTNALICFKL